MKENKNLEFAGDLIEELQEAQKVQCIDTDVARGRTFTEGCSNFLTIICC